MVRTNTWLLASAALVVAAAAVSVYLAMATSRTERVDSAAIESRDEKLRETKTRRRELRERVRRKTTRTIAQPPPPIERQGERDAGVPKSTEEPAPLDGTEDEAAQERQRKEQRASLEDHFAKQAYGGDWSRDTSMAINNALTDRMKPPGMVLESVECRETLCRVEVATSDETNYEDAFQTMLHARWSFGTGAFFLSRDDANGSTEGLVMFLAQNGVELPGIVTP
jgi:hypothetical protein